MTRELRADLLDPAGADVGEGPAWDAAAGCLVWVDITAGLVHLTEEDGGRRASMQVGRHVGAALPAEGGGYLLAAREGFVSLSPGGSLRTVCDVYGRRPDMRFNDAKCDPAGRAYGSTMAYDYVTAPRAAALLRLDPGPAVTVVRDGVTLGNGLAWNADGSVFYFVDSVTQSVTVYAYDLDAGAPTAVRGVLEVPPAVGMPDGLCVDGDGGLWVGLWGGSAVHRYTPDGRLDTVVRLPVSQVTSCAFGGADGGTLYITTAAHRLSAGQRAAEPYAGGLFAVRPGTGAGPATPWRPLPPG